MNEGSIQYQWNGGDEEYPKQSRLSDLIGLSSRGHQPRRCFMSGNPEPISDFPRPLRNADYIHKSKNSCPIILLDV